MIESVYYLFLLFFAAISPSSLYKKQSDISWYSRISIFLLFFWLIKFFAQIMIIDVVVWKRKSLKNTGRPAESARR